MSDEKKKILLIQACGEKSADMEVTQLALQASAYGLDVKTFQPKNEKEIADQLRAAKYHYIYLATHGDAIGLCSKDSKIKMTWPEFSLMLCETNCMTEDCIIMLSCCRGGLNQVAYTMFYNCYLVDFIIGPRINLAPKDLLICFTLFLYHVEYKGADPETACDKTQAGTGVKMMCYDRLQTENEAAYILFKQQADSWKPSEKEMNEQADRMLELGVKIGKYADETETVVEV